MSLLIKYAVVLTVDSEGTIHKAVIDEARRASEAAWSRFEGKYGGPIPAT